MTADKLTLYVLPSSSRCTSVMVTAKIAKTDFDLKILNLEQTKEAEYLTVHPLGKVPGAKTPEGNLFESNAISRYIARAGAPSLLGSNIREKSLVDQFLDIIRQDLASLFKVGYAAYGLPMLSLTRGDFERGVSSLVSGLKFLDSYLKDKKFLVGSSLTLADIDLVCDLVNTYRYIFTADQRNALSNLTKYFYEIVALPEFKNVLGNIPKLEKRANIKFLENAPKAQEAPKKAPVKKETPKAAVKEEEPVEEKKPEIKFPDSKFNFFDFKTLLTNATNKKDAIDFLLKNFDHEAFSIWFFRYDKLPSEGKILFQTRNFLTGFLSRADIIRKHTIGSIGIYGKDGELDVKGVWMWKGKEEMPLLEDHSQWEYFQRRKLDLNKSEDVQLLCDYWCNKEEDKDIVENAPVRHWMLFK